MNNFKPGGIRHRRDDIGGRPRSDADYSTKNRFDKKPRHESRGNDRYENRGPKEVQLFQATCTTCGKACEVPFRPDGTKPVLCRSCFADKNASPANSNVLGQRDRYASNNRDDRKPDRNFDSPRQQTASGPTSADIATLTRQISTLESKVTQILELIKNQEVKALPVVVVKEAVKKEPVPKTVKEVKVKAVTVKKVAKKTVVKKVAKKAAKK